MMVLLLLPFTNVIAQIPIVNKMIAEEIKVSEFRPISPSQIYSKKENNTSLDFKINDITKARFEENTDFKPKELNKISFANNPFDIEDLSNPFNLSYKGSCRKILKTNTSVPKFENFFSSLFQYKNQEKKTAVNKRPSPVVPFWMFFSILGTLSLLSYIFVNYKIDIKKTILSYSNITSSSQKIRENNFSVFNFLADNLFFLTAGQFLFLATNILTPEDSHADWSFMNLLLLTSAVMVVYFLKTIQLNTTVSIFPLKNQLDFYKSNIWNGNRILGLSLTPIVFFSAYSPEPLRNISIYLGLLLFISTLTYRVFRTLISSWEIIVSNKFHFFLYLCAVELTPILIVLKYFSII